MTTTKQYDSLNRLTLNQSALPSGTVVASSDYEYNLAGQRVRCAQADGSYWVYTYDNLGQVTSGRKYWPDGTIVAGQQFEYADDDIGNRTATKAGGDQNGQNLRSAGYTANRLNQYTQRDVPGYVDVMGIALANSSVTVNGNTVPSTSRKGEYFRYQLTAANSTAAAWPSVTAVQGTSTSSHNVFVAQTPEQFTYDLDGNLKTDGRWTYTWDAENRLTTLVSCTTVGTTQKLAFEYDWQGRRIHKQVWPNTAGTGTATLDERYIYDGWNLIAVINSSSILTKSFVWGLDLSGSLQGAGGVGGLLWMNDTATATTHFAAHDGNGNVTILLNAADNSSAGQTRYDYAPFGEVLRATGPMATTCPFRFSTKYTDDETDFLYYGYRYYNPSTGRWLSRDPMDENGGLNLYCFVNNNANLYADILGLEPADGWTRVAHFKKGFDRNVAAVIYMGLTYDVTVEKRLCCYRLKASIEGEIGGGWKYEDQGSFKVPIPFAKTSLVASYGWGFDLSIAELKAQAETTWSWCPVLGSYGHDDTVIRVVDFTIGPTASVNGSIGLSVGNNVGISGSVTGTVYANARVIGGIKIESAPNGLEIDAVGTMTANAGYTAKGTYQLHLWKLNLPPTTWLDVHNDVGGGDVLDPKLEYLFSIWP